MAKRSRKPSAASQRQTATTQAAKKPIADWQWGLLLVVAVILTYIPVWWAGYVWDDSIHLTSNPCITGPLGLKEIWTTHAASICPLVLTSFWMEHALWAMTPLPYHLVNVALHAASALVLWRVLRGVGVPGAWLGAALWALHPLQVESVAWVSETKNTQSCLFYLLTLLFFIKWLKSRDGKDRAAGKWNYVWMLVFAALAMASKFSTAMLPLVLALCAWWVEGRLRWRSLLPLAPVVVMSLLAAAATLWPDPTEHSPMSDPYWGRSWPERIEMTGDVVWFYLGKLVCPWPLMTIYPRWKIDPGQLISALPLLAVVVVLGLFWLKRGSWGRPWFFAFAYFICALSPFLGLIDQSYWIYSFVEDHLQNLAGMGPLALAGAGLAQLPRPKVRAALAAGWLLLLALVSWNRCWVYQNMDTLWNDELAKNPNCWAAYNSLGAEMADKGQLDKAMDYYRKTLVLCPRSDEAHYNLGTALLIEGRLDEAIAQFQQALEIDPLHVKAHCNLGIAFFKQGRVDDAITHFRRAVEIYPIYAKAHCDLGIALLKKDQVGEAIEKFQKTLEIDPRNPEAHYYYGVSLIKKGQFEDAATQFQDALRWKPDYPNAQHNLDQARLLANQKANQKSP